MASSNPGQQPIQKMGGIKGAKMREKLGQNCRISAIFEGKQAYFAKFPSPFALLHKFVDCRF
jgi:hypothetical protein